MPIPTGWNERWTNDSLKPPHGRETVDVGSEWVITVVLLRERIAEGSIDHWLSPRDSGEFAR